MSRKVFISFLGTSNYGLCDYQRDGVSYGTSRFIQEVTLNYLMSRENWDETSSAFILMTADSELKNWNDSYYKDRTTGEPLFGLATCLDQMHLPFPVYPVTQLPVGNNESEIWDIFQRVFGECIREEDELYFDITHGYRYLPTLIVVLGNYAKFLKNVSVKSITYGNYEISNHGQNPGLLVDLLPLSALQDWTNAAGQFIKTGDASPLNRIGMDTVRPLMKIHKGQDANVTSIYQFIKLFYEMAEDLRTCRGIDIIKSSKINRLRGVTQVVDASVIPPLEPVLVKMKESFQYFDDNENIWNGIEAARWCFKHGLYQQSSTLLQESVVSAVCMDMGIGWQSREQRSPVSFAFNVKDVDSMMIPEYLIGREQEIRQCCANELLCSLKSIYERLTDLRNDINHAGMRGNMLTPEKIKSNLEKHLTEVVGILQNRGDSGLSCLRPSLLLNISNHPSHQWCEVQREAAENLYGKIHDIPFPDIDPSCSVQEIAGLADSYLCKVLDLASSNTVVVHLMGEMTFLYSLLKRLQNHGINCVASTSKRQVVELPDGEKIVKFDFVGFRSYE